MVGLAWRRRACKLILNPPRPGFAPNCSSACAICGAPKAALGTSSRCYRDRSFLFAPFRTVEHFHACIPQNALRFVRALRNIYTIAAAAFSGARQPLNVGFYPSLKKQITAFQRIGHAADNNKPLPRPCLFCFPLQAPPSLPNSLIKTEYETSRELVQKRAPPKRSSQKYCKFISAGTPHALQYPRRGR